MRKEADMLRRMILGVGITLVVAVLAGCGAAATPATSDSGASPTLESRPSSGSIARSPSPAFDCDEETTGCAGPLATGEHRTAHFDHPFSFTVPDGWTNDRDIYRAYTLRSALAPHAEFIVWSHAAPARQTPDCSPARRAGFGTSVAEWLRSLKTDERLDVTMRESFYLGTHAATRVEVKAKPTFNVICEGNTDPFAVLVTDTEIPPTRHHGAGGSMTLVDFGDDAVVIWNDGGDVSMERMVELSLPVIHSINFQS
jgi:hypothetical protein